MKIFISYSSNDKIKVTQLVRDLEAEGLEIWFDEDKIYPGDDILEKMKQGIDQSEHYVLCLSRSFTKKPPQSWVKHEFRIAMLKENRESKNCIVPVRINSGGDVPRELGGRAYADLSRKVRWVKNFPKLVEVLKISKPK